MKQIINGYRIAANKCKIIGAIATKSTKRIKTIKKAVIMYQIY